MKNQKGVTLLVLVTTFIILALIVGSVSYSSVSSIKMKSYYNLCSDVELLDEKIALYYIENDSLPVSDADTKSINDVVKNYSQNNVNYNPNNSGNLKKINISQLGNVTLNYTNYYLDAQSHTVYLVEGIELDGITYYTTPINYEKVDLTQYQ